ncbi:Tyrosine/serine-protein phosphatase IphP-type, partial [Collybia nuda]
MSDTRDIQTILSSPPFVVVEGVVNIRHLGGYAASDSQWVVKPMAIFRSGEPSSITEAGKEQLRALGVVKVFDLRSEQEIKQFKTASPTIEGIEMINAPVYTKDETFDPANIEKLLKRFEADEIGTGVRMYLDILDQAGPAFRVVFQHITHEPNNSCLVHCTSGKDRTGLFSALLLMV